MAKDLAIVLNSGSINSSIATAIASQRYRLVMLHAETGEGPSARRRAAFDLQVAHFKPYREHSLPMPFLAGVQQGPSQSALASDPRAQVGILGPRLLDLMPLIAASVRYAAHFQAAAIYLGVRIGGTGDELATATEYTQIWNELIQIPCGLSDLEILAPLMELEPWQVIEVGFNVNAPFDKTWSCLEDSSEPCWACPACRARERAFQQAGKVDPMRIVKRQ